MCVCRLRFLCINLNNLFNPFEAVLQLLPGSHGPHQHTEPAQLAATVVSSTSWTSLTRWLKRFKVHSWPGKPQLTKTVKLFFSTLRLSFRFLENSRLYYRMSSVLKSLEKSWKFEKCSFGKTNNARKFWKSHRNKKKIYITSICILIFHVHGDVCSSNHLTGADVFVELWLSLHQLVFFLKNADYSFAPTSYCFSENLSACQRLTRTHTRTHTPPEWSVFRVRGMFNTNTAGMRSQHRQMWTIMPVNDKSQAYSRPGSKFQTHELSNLNKKTKPSWLLCFRETQQFVSIAKFFWAFSITCDLTGCPSQRPPFHLSMWSASDTFPKYKHIIAEAQQSVQ